MDFRIINDSGKIINCKCLNMFSDEKTGINYIIYKDDNSSDILASRYNIINNEIKLESIENEYEWDFIDKTILEIAGE